MAVTSVEKDLNSLTLTVVAEFDAPMDRVWLLWADPRKLERWWGPPTFPATVVKHDLRPGGLVTYFMTGPAGETSRGLWEVRSVDAPRRIAFEDWFADAEGKPNRDLPGTKMVVELRDREGGGTTVRMVSTFASIEQMQQLVEMGMEEGLKAAVGQMDDVLAAA